MVDHQVGAAAAAAAAAGVSDSLAIDETTEDERWGRPEAEAGDSNR